MQVSNSTSTTTLWLFSNSTRKRRFRYVNNSRYSAQLLVGHIAGLVKDEKPSKAAAPNPRIFGDLVPWGDPTWYQRWHSPYYNESHVRFRAATREFVEKELIPNIEPWDEGLVEYPIKEIAQKAAKAGLLASVVGPPWPAKYAGNFIAGTSATFPVVYSRDF